MCTSNIDERIEKFTNSDVMKLAEKTFNGILDQLQSSRLNFQLQLSPFSAVISLKKSFVKDLDGNSILPSHQETCNTNFELTENQQNLEEKLQTLTKNYNDLLIEYERSNKTIGNLEMQLESYKNVKLEPFMDESQFEIKISTLEKTLAERDRTIASLKIGQSTVQNVVKKLNTEVTENRKQFQDEKNIILKQNRAEVKVWKKELGQANSRIIKLEKKIKMSKVPSIKTSVSKASHPTEPTSEVIVEQIKDDMELCSICATRILNYTPKYFMGNMFNPACENCSEEELDPFSSFPSEDLPPSLVAHWSPSLDVAKNLPQQSFGHMSFFETKFTKSALCQYS